jgi:riboflavin kinase / FMN adenylyltransferase
MRVIRHLGREPARLSRVVLTLGNFDGLHRGHQAILQRALAAAAAIDGQVVALTFHPHPMAVVAPQRAPASIQSLHDRLAMLRVLGVPVVVLQRFTPVFAQLEPEAFVREFLGQRLELRHVVVGYDVNFGRNRSGSAETLRTLGAALGFQVDVVGAVQTDDGLVVSSSAIRRALAAGEVDVVARLLGRPHLLRGRVAVGDRRGRTLGFPTANLQLPPRLLIPADGVYAGWVPLDGARLPAVLNIGMRPTFGGLRRTIEVHCLDWSGDLYGQWLGIELVARLRGEQRFTGPAALVQQIAADVAQARAVLAAVPAAGVV